MEIGDLITGIQALGIIIPLIGIIALVRKEQGKSSMFLMLTNIGCLIMNGGYYMLLRSSFNDVAHLAYSVEYVGNIVFYMFFVLFILSFMHIKYPKILAYIWAVFEFFGLVAYWEYPDCTLVFNNISFVYHDRTEILTVNTDVGAIYLIRYGIICVLLLFGMIYTTLKLRKVESRSAAKNLWRLAGAQFIVMLSNVLMIIFDFDYDIVPLSASVSIISIILSVMKGEMFSITESGRQWVFEHMEAAFIIVDGSYGYLESNVYANEIFVDLKSKAKNERISEELYELMTREQNEELIHGKYYEKQIVALKEKNDKVMGYSLLLIETTEQHEFKENLRREVEKQTYVAEERRKSVERMSLQLVHALASTIDAKDSYTNGHSARVAKYSVMIAERMGYADEKLERLKYAALLHDIGKIGIPNEIINKTSKLTDEEYEVIKTHPAIGANILKEITELPDISIGARWHHERYDGRGYPDKLSGENIPEIARIIGVADAYDAMTSKRSYRNVLSQEKVYSEVEKGRGTQFDPKIADIMLSLMKEDKEYTMHE